MSERGRETSESLAKRGLGHCSLPPRLRTSRAEALAGDGQVADADEAQELGGVGVGHVDRDGVAAGDGHRAGDARGGEVVLGRVACRDGVDRDVLGP